MFFRWTQRRRLTALITTSSRLSCPTWASHYGWFWWSRPSSRTPRWSPSFLLIPARGCPFVGGSSKGARSAQRFLSLYTTPSFVRLLTWTVARTLCPPSPLRMIWRWPFPIFVWWSRSSCSLLLLLSSQVWVSTMINPGSSPLFHWTMVNWR